MLFDSDVWKAFSRVMHRVLKKDEVLHMPVG